jgi:hypothetical protein
MEYLVIVTWRGESPCAAPTRWKRGPWRSHRTGRQGRLPTSLAIPRRGFHSYLFPYKHIVDTEPTSSPTWTWWKLILAVGAMGGRARGLGGRAMVDGMAMAAYVSMDMGGGRTNTLPLCTKHGQMTLRGARLDTKGYRIVGFMVEPFTTIHTRLPMSLTMGFGVFVWGCLPRGTAENWSPTSDGVGAMRTMALA